MCKTPFARTHGLCMNDVLENDTYGTQAQKLTQHFTRTFEKLQPHLHLDKSQNLQTSRFNVSDVYSRGEAERFIGLIC